MSLAFDRSGEGPALVLLHPLGADRRVWDAVVPRLAAQRDVIALDLPGFGESAPLSAQADARCAGRGRGRAAERTSVCSAPRRRQLARRLGRARDGTGGSGSLGHGDRAGGSVGRAAGAQALDRAPDAGPGRAAAGRRHPRRRARDAVVLLAGSVAVPERVPASRRRAPRPRVRNRARVRRRQRRDAGGAIRRLWTRSGCRSPWPGQSMTGSSPGPAGYRRTPAASCSRVAVTFRCGTTRKRWRELLLEASRD